MLSSHARVGDHRRGPVWVLLALVALTADAPAAPLQSGQASDDQLSREIARLTTVVSESRPGDELWGQVRPSSEAALTEAKRALDAGRRLAAFDRMAAARTNLAAAIYVREHEAAGKDLGSLEAEWTRMGNVLRPELPAAPGPALSAVRPAAVRAVGEAALSQVRAYYEAGLEYGRNTTPDSGLFYIGAARAQQELVTFSRGWSAPTTAAAPPVRPIAGEIEALETELLNAYRPPRSIERHRDFIAASSAIKEARELDRKGLRYGALYRYLQASVRVAGLVPTAAPDATAAGDAVKRYARDLAEPRVDHSLGQLFLEQAQMALDATPPNAERAAVLAGVVLPRYVAALGPARPAATATPRVTITLVRWPFT